MAVYYYVLLVLTAVVDNGSAQFLPFGSFGCPLTGLPFRNFGYSRTLSGIPFPGSGGVGVLGGFGNLLGGTLDQQGAFGGSLASGQNELNPNSIIPECGQRLGIGGSTAGQGEIPGFFRGSSGLGFGGGSAGQVGIFGGISGSGFGGAYSVGQGGIFGGASGSGAGSGSAGQVGTLEGSSAKLGGSFESCRCSQQYTPDGLFNSGVTGKSLGRFVGVGSPGYGFGGPFTPSGFRGIGMIYSPGIQGIGSKNYYGCADGYNQNSLFSASPGQNSNANLVSTAGTATSYGNPSFNRNLPVNDPIFGNAYPQVSPFMRTSSQCGRGLPEGMLPECAKICSAGPISGQGSTQFYEYINNSQQENQQCACASKSASYDPSSDNKGRYANGPDNLSRLNRQSSCRCCKCK